MVCIAQGVLSTAQGVVWLEMIVDDDAVSHGSGHVAARLADGTRQQLVEEGFDAVLTRKHSRALTKIYPQRKNSNSLKFKFVWQKAPCYQWYKWCKCD